MTVSLPVRMLLPITVTWPQPSILQQNGFVVNADRCLLGCVDIKFLGYRCQHQPSSVQDAGHHPVSTAGHSQEASGFLGPFQLLQEVHPCCGPPGAASYQRFMRQAKGLTTPWVVHRDVGSLCSSQAAAGLDHPPTEAELLLVTYASATHVGPVIQQTGQNWRPLGLFSAQLDKARVNYSAFVRELFAVVTAIRQFRFILMGRPSVVFTDHKRLVGALSRHSEP